MPTKFKFGSDDNNKGLLIGITVVVIAVIIYFVFFKKQNNIYYDVSVLIANIYFIYVSKMLSLLFHSDVAKRTKNLTLCDNFIRSRLKSQGYTFEEVTIKGSTGSNQINISRQAFINIKKGSTLLFDNNDNFLDNNGKIVKAKPQTGDIDILNITFLNSDGKEIFIYTWDDTTYSENSFGDSSTEIQMLNLPKIKFI